MHLRLVHSLFFHFFETTTTTKRQFENYLDVYRPQPRIYLEDRVESSQELKSEPVLLQIYTEN
jgi:hypothetical protein